SPLLNFLLLKLGIFLAAFSIVFLIEKSRDGKKWLFNIIWLPYAILYLQDLRIDATHIWLNRRYLMFILFALIVSVVGLLVSLYKSLKGKWRYLTKGLVVILLLFYLGSFMIGSSSIWKFREMKGLGADLQNLNEKLDDAGFIIIDGVAPYSLRPLLLPLQNQFNRRVGILRNRSAHIDSLPGVCEELAERYGDVYYLAPGVGAGDMIPGFWEYKGFNRFDIPMLEKPDLHDYRPPTEKISYGMDIHIYRFFSKKVYAEKSYDVDIGGSDDIYLSGEWYGKESLGEMNFRWSGPFAVINLSNTVRGEFIEIRMAQGPKFESMKNYKTKIRIDGGAELEVKPSYDWTVYRLPLDKELKTNGPLRVFIESTPWELTDPRTGETRELGLMIDWIKVIRSRESSLPKETKLIK
ncbi:MAG: hypothetical protein JW737_07805, partial [Acidobacteria bacterium]|nr:hypothetical protein [Acidobacteriota bacterium]